MRILLLILNQSYIGLALVLLVVPFIFLGCSHGPPHDDGVIMTSCGDTKGAVWENEPGREGKVTVTWFQASQDPEDIDIDVHATTPLRGDARGPLNQIKNHKISSFGSDTFIDVCCDNHNVTKALFVTHGTGKDFTFDGDRSNKRVPFGSIPLIKLETWTVNHCRKSDPDHTDRPVDIPISVEITCRRPNGSEYNAETTLEFKTVSTCKHQF